MMRRKKIVAPVLACMLVASGVAIYVLAAPAWDVPRLLACEGKLADAAGAPVTGDKTITFRIWDDATSKDAAHKLWDETLTVSFGAGGEFHAALGATAGDELPATLFQGGSRWLGMEVGSSADAAGELAPRMLLQPVPWALAAGESARLAAGTDLDDGKIGGGRVGDLVSTLQGGVTTLTGTVTALEAQVAALRLKVDAAQDGSCPAGYARDTGAVNFILCKKGADEMVKVGDFWIDRYESIVVDAAYWNSGRCDGSAGTIYGGATDNWSTVSTFPFTGNWTAPLYSCSKTGVGPSRWLTWFQAQQALAASGKYLCTNGEWQAAAAGTPDPGSSGGGSGACVTNGSYRNTGSGYACASRWGAQDMIGNLWEWTDLWGQSGKNSDTSFIDGKYYGTVGSGNGWDGFSPETSGDGDGTWNLNGRVYRCERSGGNCYWKDGLPFAALRGGDWGRRGQGAAGIFAIDLGGAPSDRDLAFGFRGCRR